MAGQQQPNADAGVKVLHVHSEGAFIHMYRITDSDKTTILYTVNKDPYSQPNVKVYSSLGPQNPESTETDRLAVEVGSATVHDHSKDIEMVVRGQGIKYTRAGKFSSGHAWYSPAMGGVLVKWKTDGVFTSDKICYVEGQKDRPIARWVRAGMGMAQSKKKKGRIHILDLNLCGPGNAGFEVIVVSAMIEMVAARRRLSNMGSAAAGSASFLRTRR